MRFDWQVVSLAALGRRLVDAGGSGLTVVAVNGHSSSGKTSLAGRLPAVVPGCAVLHTDDLAWHQGVFAWDRLLLDDVLPVVRSGAALDFRPPAWRQRGRDGSIQLPGELALLVVEGVGSSQASVRAELDAVIWVETDEPTRLARDAPRLAAGEMSADSYAGWMAEENAYVVREQPWRQADLIVYGGDSSDHDRTTEVVLSRATPERSAPRT